MMLRPARTIGLLAASAALLAPLGAAGAGADGAGATSFQYFIQSEKGTSRADSPGLVLHARMEVEHSAAGPRVILGNGDGTMTLPPSVAPAHHRAWHLSEERPPELLGATVESGRDGRTSLRDIRVLLHFEPSSALAGDRASLTIELGADDPAASCTTLGGCASTGTISYDAGDDSTPLRLPAVQTCREAARRS